MNELTRKVYNGVHAILIERIRVALEKSEKSIAQIFSEKDVKNVGYLTK